MYRELSLTYNRGVFRLKNQRMIAEAWKSRYRIIPENLDCKHRWQLTDDFEKQPGEVPTL